MSVSLQSFSEYQEYALRTSKFKNLIFDPSSSYPADPSRVAVACMGLAGELGELCYHVDTTIDSSSFNFIVNELGDFLYYIAELASACGIFLNHSCYNICNTEQITPNCFLNDCRILAFTTGTLIDHLKKYIGHGRSFDGDFVEKCLTNILDRCSIFARRFGLSIRWVAETNVCKLLERHGETYRESYYESLPS